MSEDTLIKTVKCPKCDATAITEYAMSWDRFQVHGVGSSDGILRGDHVESGSGIPRKIREKFQIPERQKSYCVCDNCGEMWVHDPDEVASRDFKIALYIKDTFPMAVSEAQEIVAAYKADRIAQIGDEGAYGYDRYHVVHWHIERRDRTRGDEATINAVADLVGCTAAGAKEIVQTCKREEPTLLNCKEIALYWIERQRRNERRG